MIAIKRNIFLSICVYFVLVNSPNSQAESLYVTGFIQPIGNGGPYTETLTNEEGKIDDDWYVPDGQNFNSPNNHLGEDWNHSIKRGNNDRGKKVIFAC